MSIKKIMIIIISCILLIGFGTVQKRAVAHVPPRWVEIDSQMIDNYYALKTFVDKDGRMTVVAVRVSPF